MATKYCTLLFLKKDNQILLAMKKRGFGSNRYNGVGGKIEKNETIEQALSRECREEIGVIPMNYWPVAEHDFIQTENAKQPWHMHVYVYLCDEWQGEPTESEEMAPRWFEVDKIPYENMWQDDTYWLPQVLNGEKVYGEFSFDENDAIIAHKVRVVESLPHQDELPTHS